MRGPPCPPSPPSRRSATWCWTGCGSGFARASAPRTRGPCYVACLRLRLPLPAPRRRPACPAWPGTTRSPSVARRWCWRSRLPRPGMQARRRRALGRAAGAWPAMPQPAASSSSLAPACWWWWTWRPPREPYPGSPADPVWPQDERVAQCRPTIHTCLSWRQSLAPPFSFCGHSVIA